MITILISRKECNEQCNQWKAWTYTNDAKVLQILHRMWVESVQTTLFIASCQSQSETRSNTWTSTVLNLCVGSRQRNYVTRSIFCPNFCKLVTSILDLNLMNLSLKACSWINHIIRGKEILIGNTSATYHRDEWLGYAHDMHDKCNYEIEIPEETLFS